MLLIFELNITKNRPINKQAKNIIFLEAQINPYIRLIAGIRFIYLKFQKVRWVSCSMLDISNSSVCRQMHHEHSPLTQLR
jgi:hypothetical protein